MPFPSLLFVATCSLVLLCGQVSASYLDQYADQTLSKKYVNHVPQSAFGWGNIATAVGQVVPAFNSIQNNRYDPLHRRLSQTYVVDVDVATDVRTYHYRGRGLRSVPPSNITDVDLSNPDLFELVETTGTPRKVFDLIDITDMNATLPIDIPPASSTSRKLGYRVEYSVKVTTRLKLVGSCSRCKSGTALVNTVNGRRKLAVNDGNLPSPYQVQTKQNTLVTTFDKVSALLN